MSSPDPAPADGEKSRAPCFVSTFPPQRCGIGTYTAALVRAMGADGTPITVLSERGAGEGTVDGVTSRPCWSRHEDWVSPLLAAVEATGTHLVHLQHAPDIFGWDNRLPRLLDGLAARGVATVVTLHTVHTFGSSLLERRWFPGRYHRALAARVGALVVHGTATQADELLRQGVPAEKIVVIPHGTTILDPPPVADSRRRLNLEPEGQLLLYFGFIHIQKNLHTIIRAMARLAPRVPDLRMLVVGSIQNRAWFNRLYLWACGRMVSLLGLSGRVDLREGFVPSEQIQDLYGAADLVLLPYAQRYGSASGVVHNALGAGRVMVCSSSPKFGEVSEHVSDELRVATHDPDAWADRLEGLLRQDDVRAALAARIRAYAEETAWPRVAAQHMALYQRLSPVGGLLASRSIP